MREISEKTALGNALEAGFGAFRECLRYKLERRGKQLIVVDRGVPSTRTCSACGMVRGAVDHKETRWICPRCHTAHRREINAAKNIKSAGLAQICLNLEGVPA